MNCIHTVHDLFSYTAQIMIPDFIKKSNKFALVQDFVRKDDGKIIKRQYDNNTYTNVDIIDYLENRKLQFRVVEDLTEFVELESDRHFWIYITEAGNTLLEDLDHTKFLFIMQYTETDVIS